jgi:CDP-6-deoxy-D-xylo-4-hexulose-3-dehydrase
MSKAPSFRWPLMISPFTVWDRLSIAWFILSQDRYTMGRKVEELEEWFSQYSGMHALMVANGSLANTLVFELWKIKHPGCKPLVFVPAVTWISSVTPALMAGMDVEFVDINLDDFAFDYEKLEAQVKAAWERGVENIIIWPTALIGFAPDMERLTFIAEQYGADLFLDSCENTFSRVPLGSPYYEGGKQSILASADITTTSTYMGHEMSSIEGGFVFFRDKDDYEIAKMFRNHGMVRSLPKDNLRRILIESAYCEVDPQFLFALPGTNLRPSDVHAAFGLKDCQRAEQSRAHRVEIYDLFYRQLDLVRYRLPALSDTHVAFCLPIFTMWDNLAEVKAALAKLGCETRPIIGSNLLHQPPFKGYGNPEDYPNAEWVHKRGCYIGLHSGVTPEMVKELTATLNNL